MAQLKGWPRKGKKKGTEVDFDGVATKGLSVGQGDSFQSACTYSRGGICRKGHSETRKPSCGLRREKKSEKPRPTPDKDTRKCDLPPGLQATKGEAPLFSEEKWGYGGGGEGHDQNCIRR